MNLFGSQELRDDVLSTERCIGCGACIGLCPYFETHNGKTASVFPCSLETGRCFAFCPKVEVDLEALAQDRFGQSYDGSPLGVYSSVYKTKAGPNAKGGSFQNGGTVSALMEFALQDGSIDGAILTDQEGVLPIPRLVTDPKDVYSCAGSKYASAPTLSELNRAIESGYSKLGLVGTSCQTLAAAQMRANPMGQADFKDPVALVVGIFCTWSLNYRTLAPFLAEITPIESITKIDVPPPPSEILEVHTSDGKLEIPLDEIRQKIPDSCGYCPDMTAEFADISVGAFEGQAEMNTLIVRTEAGAKLLAAAEAAGYLAVEEMPGENLDHLAGAAASKKKRAMLKNQEEGLLNTSGKNGRAAFRLDDEVVEGICQ